MFTAPVQLTDVIYNAANQTFAATVTVHDSGRAYRYACEIDAPISMPFDTAAKGLTTKATRLHQRKTGLHSTFSRSDAASAQQSFDLSRWLKDLMNRPGNLAA